MVKKTPLLGFILFVLFVVGTIFLWQADQKEVKELNATLPDGIKVTKGFLSDNYGVVNKIDGYEFGVPREWGGVKEVEYIPEREVEDITVVSIGLEGLEGGARILSLDVYILDEFDEVDLFSWAQNIWNIFELEGELSQDNVERFSVVRAQEDKHLGGTFVYFLKELSKIYVFNNGSEEFIREIILSGKW